ncbi:unnamed protein product [Prorocentrum cordatum]|nr:unnamed protein product [Polarella glacialis]
MSVGRLATGSGVCFFLKCLLASDIIIEERADTSVLLALGITGVGQRSLLMRVSLQTIGRGVCFFLKCFLRRILSLKSAPIRQACVGYHSRARRYVSSART